MTLPEAPESQPIQAPPQNHTQTTRGNNRAARHTKIDADLRQENVVHTRRQRRLPERFSGVTFVMARCFATAIMKPTVGSKLSDLPPEPRNYRDFKKHPRRPQLQVAMDAEYEALINNKTWRPATPDEISKH